MSVKKALDILREPIRPTTDAIRMMRLWRNINDARVELEAVQEAQSKPEPGEFTKELRQYAKQRIAEISSACDERCRKLRDYYEPKSVDGVDWAEQIASDQRVTKAITEPFEKLLQSLDITDRQTKQLAAKDKEIERLKGVIDCYERKPASVECSNCGEVIRTV